MEYKRSGKIKELLDSRNNGLIKIITGVRRCGKSYLLNTLFKDYLLNADEYDDEHIIQFAFDKDDDIDKLRPFAGNEEIKIKQGNGYVINSFVFRKYINSKIQNGCYLLLLDEIQYLQDFVTTLNSYIDKKNLDVFVTGSNSKFLSSDIATEFRGRGDVIPLTPLTYKEIFEQVGGDKQKVLDQYLQFGGLPLTLQADSIEKKMSYLKTTFDATYKRDILDKISKENKKQLDELINILSSNIGSLLNVERIKNTFKSKEHIDIGANTINNYIDLMCDCFLVKQAKRYDVKGRKYISTPSKYYFVDPGIRNSILNFRQIEKNHIMENVIFNDLISKGYNVDIGSISIYEANNMSSYSKKSLEIDFVANKGDQKIYIQSAYSIDDTYKLSQEERPLSKIDDGFQRIIVVYDDVLTHYSENGNLIIGLANFLLK